MSATSASSTFAAWLSAARSGSGREAGALLERYRAYLELLARLRAEGAGSKPEDASDVAQETFLRAGRAIGQFRGCTEREFVAWLRRILGSVLANEHRQGRPAALRLVGELDRSSAALDRGLFSPGKSPSQEACGREAAVRLADALALLPEDYRQVLILHHLQGRTLAEVAAEMGRSLDSVRKLWLRGLARIRELLGETP